jgi:hypothetical protein
VPNVYKVTYPNGKVYVDQDLLDQFTYIESISNAAFATDFPPEQQHDFTVRKEILWESEDADHDEVTRVMIEWILRLRSNDPAVGYNRWPPVDGS